MLKLGFLVFFFLSTVLLLVVNHEVKTPYMDEIFHFPQALKYYHGVFSEWDPKITTPPGLYFSTLSLLLPLSGLTGVDLNKVQSFRLTNLLFSLGNFYLFYKILGKYNEGYDAKIYVLSALNLATFPVLYFFTFLYYTDCGSTFFVLLMYYLHLKHSFVKAAVAGAISLFFRQTNIVWVFYVAAGTTLDLLQVLYERFRESDSHKLKYRNQNKTNEDWRSLSIKLLGINAGYILVAAGFLYFVYQNGSVALGDKEAHRACFNVPQLLYFSLFFFTFSCPYLFSIQKAKDFLRFVCAHKVRVLEACLACAFVITNLTYVHPYLLADNRHFTFYVWRRILGRNANLSLALIPAYVYCFWSVWTELEHKNHVFKALLALCIFVSVVPQRLLEFRYFIVPYVMLRIQFKIRSHWIPYLEFSLYTLVNYVTMYVFLCRTFTWENSVDVQRFMW